MGVEGLHVLRVERAAARRAAARQAEGDGHGMPCGRNAWRIVDDLVEPIDEKSANCFSTTGRMPSMAAPIAMPAMASSAIGQSITRPGSSATGLWSP